jgi:tetratricopeptide (TPR) repeat protein
MSWFSLGWAAWALKRWAVAEDALRRARALSPQESNNHNNLGALLARRGRFDEALACFQRALELDPHSPWSYRNAAYCLRSLGRWDEGDALAERDALNKLHDADRQLAEGPSSPVVTRRARALIMLERMQEAEAVLEKAVELAENADQTAMPLQDLAGTKLVLGNDHEARRLAERLLREYADDPNALLITSKIGWIAGDAQLAARAAEAAANERLDPSAVAGCAANAALAQGDWSRAEHHLLHKLELGRVALAECCTHAQLAAAHHYRADTQGAASEIAEATRAEPHCWTLILLRDRLGIPTQVPSPSI